MSTGIGKRRQKRIPAALPVRLWGMDAHGRPFIEVSTTKNVSRTGTLLAPIPAKLAEGDIIGLRCNEKKYRFRVVWTGEKGSVEEGCVGLQSLETGKWIWDGLRLPPDDTDTYARPPQLEKRQVKRLQCLVSAEIVSNSESHVTHRILAFVTNLSVRGCYVRIPYPLPVAASVSVALWIDEQHKIWVDGIVISSHPQVGLGLKFLNVTRRNAEAIERCMEMLSADERITVP